MSLSRPRSAQPPGATKSAQNPEAAVLRERAGPVCDKASNKGRAERESAMLHDTLNTVITGCR